MNAKIKKGPQTLTDELPKGLGEYLFESAEKYGDTVFQLEFGFKFDSKNLKEEWAHSVWYLFSCDLDSHNTATRCVVLSSGLFYNRSVQLFAISVVNASTMVTLGSTVTAETYLEVVAKYQVIDVHTGELLGPNKEGEILVKSPSQMLGYYNRPFPTELYDEDGFYKTGDLGYYDEDDYFYVVDRITDMYKYRSHSMMPKILKGPKTANDIPMGLGEYFFESAEKYGDRVFQIHYHTNESVTFNEMKKRSVKIALNLQKSGVKPGDVVMFLGKNDIDNTAAVLAAVLLGALVSSLDMKLGLFDIKHCIDLAKPKFVIVVEERLELIEKALTEIGFDTKIVVLGKKSRKYINIYDTERDSFEEEDSFRPFKVDVKKDAAFIIFSSGTTSMPKAVLWSYFTSMYGLVKGGSFETAASLETRPTIQFLGLYYNLMIQTLCASLVNGSTMVSLETSISWETYFEIIDKFQINSLIMIAELLHKLITVPEEEIRKYNITSLKLMTVVGSSVGGQYILKLRERFPAIKVVQGYGSSEIGSGCFLWTSEELNSKSYDMKPGSSGKAGDNVEAKVIDIHTGELLGPNQEGEILVKSPSKMLGYYHRQLPTELYDEDGFYKTGDFGYYDEDEYFYIVDRITDIYKYHSHNLCPVMIETLLMKHPAIKEAIVAGVPHPVDDYHGAACVVLNEGFDISTQEIDNYISENLGDMYRLRGGVKFVEEIPKTVSGKLKRRAVREMFLQRT